MKKDKIKKHTKEFFRNKFILRFIIWVTGIIIFCLGLNFIVHSGVGQDVYDAFFNGLRTAIGASIANYGLAILLPGGALLTIIALVLHYIRTKKIRIDYILSIFPLIFSGYIIDLFGKLDFFTNMQNQTNNADVLFLTYPLHILWVLIGIPLLYFGIGMFSGVRVMPNPYAILILEISVLWDKKFSIVQIIVDTSFVLLGLILMIICASVGRHIDGGTVNWYDILKVVSFGTAVSMMVQGLIVGKTLMLFERLFKYHRAV